MTDTNEKKGDLHARAIALYTPPFRFDFGYIWDAKGQMVADNRVPDEPEGAALRVRGWGRISYMEDPEALQDEVGNIIAAAMTEYWERRGLPTVCVREDLDINEIEEVIRNSPPGKIVVTPPEYPKTLPCPVVLEPGMRFGKGVATSTVLKALQRRAEYYAELDAMTPEERAKHDANIEAFREMLSNPPAAPEDPE